MSSNGREWFEDYAEDTDDLQIDEYDITASPNDFNVSTLYNFVEFLVPFVSWFSTQLRLGQSAVF